MTVRSDEELAAILRGDAVDDVERARYAPVVVDLLAEQQTDLRRRLHDALGANARLTDRLIVLGDELVEKRWRDRMAAQCVKVDGRPAAASGAHAA